MATRPPATVKFVLILVVILLLAIASYFFLSENVREATPPQNPAPTEEVPPASPGPTTP